MHCLILHLTSNTPFHNQLPHFRKLINLEIGCLDGRPNVGSYIRHYFNLKSIHLMKTSSFTVKLVAEISNIGTYKQLEILCVNEDWREDIDVKALELLIRHCALLKRIELVGSSSIQRDVFMELSQLRHPFLYICVIRNCNEQLLYSSISSLHVSAPVGHPQVKTYQHQFCILVKNHHTTTNTSITSMIISLIY
jgi:hypothetical protein